MQPTAIVDDNALTLLPGGGQRLDALIALIEQARVDLRLLYYIYADDNAGRRVRDALIAAIGRGVRVMLIVDGFGSGTDGDDALMRSLRDGGADVCAFLPRWGRRFLMRNHQKFALADSARAIVGGFNLADDYFADEGPTAWRDLGLLVEGRATHALAGYFDALSQWTKRDRARLRDLQRELRNWSSHPGPLRWLLGGPTRRLSPWARSLRNDLAQARDATFVAAYFAPSPAVLRRLYAIGRTGNARIVTAAKTDNAATIAAARFTYPGLLRRGVRVFEYRPMRLHTKLYVIDDIVHIGSANLDMRSLFLNLEVMLRIEDAGFAAAMRAYVDGEIAQATERHLPEFRGVLSWPARLRHMASYFLVAVLDYNVTRRINLPID